jgi:hypothetical protein
MSELTDIQAMWLGAAIGITVAVISVAVLALWLNREGE